MADLPGGGRFQFDEADVLEFAEGRVADLFGPRYEAVDKLPVRVRVPGLPMLAISRVTEIAGIFGRFSEARIRTEFDIPIGFWNSVEGQASALVLDPQGVQFLLGWLGVDLETMGRCSFRWVSGELVYLSALPRVGQTVQTEVRLRRSIRTGRSIVFSIEFDAHADGHPVLRGERCRVGMFPIDQAREKANTQNREESRATRVSIPTDCGSSPGGRRQFGTGDLVRLARGGGVQEVCGGGEWNGECRGVGLPPRIGQFVDSVPFIDLAGGRFGMGCSEAEFRLDPLHWCVRTHFKDDPVFPGPCVLEGAKQLVQLHLLTAAERPFPGDARFEPILNRRMRIRFNSPVIPRRQQIRYRADIVSGALGPDPYVVADIECISEGMVVGRIEGMGVRMASGGIEV